MSPVRNDAYGGGTLVICRHCYALVPIQREAEHERWHYPMDAPGPDPDGGVELTDEEFQTYLKAARGE